MSSRTLGIQSPRLRSARVRSTIAFLVVCAVGSLVRATSAEIAVPQNPWSASSSDFQIRFDPSGVTLLSGARVAEPWRLAMTLKGFGYRGKLTAVGPPERVASEARIEYRRDSLIEWYTLGASGLKQGFTILTPPPRSGVSAEAPLHIEILLTGDGPREVRSGHDAITIYPTGDAGAGRLGLRYDELHAYDATGRKLPSELSADADFIRIEVDDRQAVYPIVVDPLIATERWVLRPEDPQRPDLFGRSTVLGGNLALIGSPGDVVGGIKSGSVRAFELQGDVWIEQDRLLPTNPANDDIFGSALTLGGNRAVVGAKKRDANGFDSGAAYVFIHDGTSWRLEAELLGSDSEAGDEFGIYMGIYGTTIIVGAPFNDGNGDNAGAGYAFVREGGVWTEQARIVPDDIAPGDTFGWFSAIEGEVAVIGSPKDDDRGIDSGSVYIFVREGTNWVQEAKLTASDGAPDDIYGGWLDISGATVAVGAYRNDRDGINSGAVYVYVKQDGEWVEQARLTGQDTGLGDQFGTTVKLQGERLAVGSIFAFGGATRTGATYIFERTGSSWFERAKLTPLDTVQSGSFGLPVWLDGESMIVGSPALSGEAGAAYVYELADSTWTQTAKISNEDYVMDNFGFSLAIEGKTALVSSPRNVDNGPETGKVTVYGYEHIFWNPKAVLEPSVITPGSVFGRFMSIQGDTIAVGAPGESNFNGAVYIFELDGETWVEQARLTVDNPQMRTFGRGVVLSGDRLIAIAPYEDTELVDSGAAYIFRRDGDVWTQETRLSASDAAELDVFGWTVAMDGDRAAISAVLDDDACPEDPDCNSGSVYIFELVDEVWTEEAKLQPDIPNAGDSFGTSLALEGNTLVVGVEGDDERGDAAGAVYIFEFDGSQWQQKVKLIPDTLEAGDNFGISVSLQDDVLAVGAIGDDDAATDAGSVRIFRREEGVWIEEGIILPSEAAEGDGFGLAVAIDGIHGVFGAPFDNTFGPSPREAQNGSGAVHFYRLGFGSLLGAEPRWSRYR